MLPHDPQDMPLWRRPHICPHPPSCLTCSHSCHLKSLWSHCALPKCLRCHPQRHLPSLCSCSALTTPYASTPPPLIILTLWRCPQDDPLTLAHHLHAHPFLIFSAAYHPYAFILDP
ncbi:hypothetical protein O181_018308 [Austropuccinia psidii MF-1]|uniref:Uncharacterized protein n=1 Tax=Austropuccinia psidii MF-1 TaxID=1389203 RepID=A0A9Q3C7Q1_9BASI|nr:hypothetical protein [Austropuccinia psidii MF-1]